MTLNNKLFFGIVFLISAFNGNAQVLNKLKYKAENTLHKVATFNQYKAEQDIYYFNQSALLELSTKGNEKTVLEFFFSKQNLELLCIKLNTAEYDDTSGTLYNVLTPTTATVFMDLPDMKIKKSITEQDIKAFDNSDKTPPKEDLKKTGNTKTLLGYLCYEYRYEKAGSVIKAWVTKDNFPIKNNYLPILGMHTNSPYEGFVLELYYESSNESGAIKVIKINNNANLVINANEFKTM